MQRRRRGWSVKKVKKTWCAIQGDRCVVTTRGTAEQDERGWCNVPRKPEGSRSMPGKVLFVVLLAGLCLSCSRERATTVSSEQAITAADGRDASSTPASASEQEEAASIPAPDAAAASAPLPATPAQPVPVPDPPEAVMADYLREPGNPMMPGRQAHAVFAAEKRDDTWADYVEAKLRDYFARQRGVGKIAIVSLACRSTMCEVLAVA